MYAFADVDLLLLRQEGVLGLIADCQKACEFVTVGGIHAFLDFLRLINAGKTSADIAALLSINKTRADEVTSRLSCRR